MKHDLQYVGGIEPYMERCARCGEVFCDDQARSRTEECSIQLDTDNRQRATINPEGGKTS